MYTQAFVLERERAAEPTYLHTERARRMYVHRLRERRGEGEIGAEKKRKGRERRERERSRE